MAFVFFRNAQTHWFPAKPISQHLQEQCNLLNEQLNPSSVCWSITNGIELWCWLGNSPRSSYLLRTHLRYDFYKSPLYLLNFKSNFHFDYLGISRETQHKCEPNWNIASFLQNKQNRPRTSLPRDPEESNRKDQRQD